MPFEELAFSLMDGLFSTALRMCGHRDRAQDLVQDTMVKGFKNFHRFEEGSNFRAWMYTILTNTFINDYRRRKRDPVARHYSNMSVKKTGFRDFDPAVFLK